MLLQLSTLYIILSVFFALLVYLFTCLFLISYFFILYFILLFFFVKTFYQRPWLDDQFDPTETWCEGKKSESDEIVGIQLIVRPGSSERRIVLNITGKAGPEDHCKMFNLFDKISMFSNNLIII